MLTAEDLPKKGERCGCYHDGRFVVLTDGYQYPDGQVKWACQGHSHFNSDETFETFYLPQFLRFRLEAAPGWHVTEKQDDRFPHSCPYCKAKCYITGNNLIEHVGGQYGCSR